MITCPDCTWSLAKRPADEEERRYIIRQHSKAVGHGG